MRITDVRATPVNIPLVAPYRFSYGSIASLTKTIVEVITDDGLVGLGELADGDQAEAVRSAGAQLVGLDSADVDEARRRLVPASHYSPWANVLQRRRVFAGIEMALWDLRGQREGQSIAELLGGPVRTRVPLTEYFSYRLPGPEHPGESSPEEIAAYCARMIADHGATAFEGKVGTVDDDEELEMVRLVRAAIGDRPLSLDANGVWTVATARRLLPRFEEFGIAGWEEPVETYEEMREIRDCTGAPLSAHLPDLPRALELGVPDVIVTNLNELGGIGGCVRLVRDCAAAGVGFRFHSGETGVACAHYLQVTAALAEIDGASQTLLRWSADDVIDGGPLIPTDGAVVVRDGPGLGVRLDPAALARCHERYRHEGAFPSGDGVEYGGGFRRR